MLRCGWGLVFELPELSLASTMLFGFAGLVYVVLILFGVIIVVGLCCDVLVLF